MKKLFKTLMIVALCGAAIGMVSCNKDDDGNSTNQSVGGFDSDGASNAVFSVSPSQKVRFSRGNLQYSSNGTHSVASGGTAPGTWRFAENQYDVIGECCYEDGVWGDNFAWGTSGWNSGAHVYQPTRPTESYGYLYDHDSSFLVKSLVGAYSKADWGVYNAISNGGNTAGMWRTLTKDEWVYLLHQRRTTFVDENGRTYDSVRYTATSIKIDNKEIWGLVLFPDTFTWPQGGVLSDWGENYAPFPGNDIVYSGAGYTPSTVENWKKFENAGAIFLPISYSSNGHDELGFSSSEGHGIYWSSTLNESMTMIEHLDYWDENSPTYVRYAEGYTLTIGYYTGDWSSHHTYVEPESSTSLHYHDGTLVRLVKSAN